MICWPIASAGCVAEDLFRSAVPRRDHPFEGLTDNCVIGRIDDRSEPRLRLWRARLRLGKVLNERNKTHHLVVPISMRGVGNLDCAQRAVSVPHRRQEFRMLSVESPLNIRFCDGVVLRSCYLPHRLAQDLFAAASEERLRRLD